MPTQTFTSGDDSYTVSAPGDYVLDFIGGNDTLVVNGGTSTTALMGEGDDVVTLQDGLAVVYGESGADLFNIWASNATAYGGADNDRFNLREGSDQSLYGGLGADRFFFYFNSLNVMVDGGDGNDLFHGNDYAIAGNIFGGTGADIFLGFNGTGALVLHGGLGNDTYRADATSPATIVELADQGIDTVQVALGISYTLPNNVERLQVAAFAGSTNSSAILTGNAIDNVIIAAGNDDIVYGLDGNDKLYGRNGADTLFGGNGADQLHGGHGDDYLFGEEGADFLNGRTGDDHMYGGIGNDIYSVDSPTDSVVEQFDQGIDTVRVLASQFTLPDNVENGIIMGSVGRRLDGNALNNVLTGGSGDDVLVDLAGGNDTLRGGSGSDYLAAGAGNDRLRGDAGADSMSGGDGNDTFLFTSSTDSIPGASDSVNDFTSHLGEGSDDQLDLSAIDANTTLAGDQAFTLNLTGAPAGVAGDLWFTVTVNTDLTLNFVFYGDTDGDSVADFSVMVHTLTTTFLFEDITF